MGTLSRSVQSGQVSAQLKGPRIMRDVSLLLRLMWRLEGWDDPSERSAMQCTVRLLENMALLKSCGCSSCNSIVDSSKTTAAILEPTIRGMILGNTEDAIEAAVYSMLKPYLLTLEEED